MKWLDRIPEPARGWFYVCSATALLVVLVWLLVVDIIQGGDAGDWLVWIASSLGFGAAGLAARHTKR